VEEEPKSSKVEEKI